MQKARGGVLIAIGSILTIIGASLGILVGILFAVAGTWFWSVVSNSNEFNELPGFSSLFLTLGAGIGILIVVISIVVLVLGVMAFKRRNDLRRSTFPFVLGIIFLIFGILPLISDFSFSGLVPLVAPLLILIGAILNKQQLKEMPELAVNSMYPGSPPNQVYGQQQYPNSGQQQYQQPPHQSQPPYGQQQQQQYPQPQPQPQPQHQPQYQAQPQYQPQEQNEQPQQGTASQEDQ